MKKKIRNFINQFLFEIVIFGMMAVFLFTDGPNKVIVTVMYVITLLYYILFWFVIYLKLDKEETKPMDSLHVTEPPDDMHPAVAGYFVRETVDLFSVYAVLLSLVNKRKLQMEKVGDDYTFTLLEKEVPLQPIDEYVLQWLFHDSKQTIAMNDFKHSFTTEESIDALQERLHEMQPLMQQQVAHLVHDNESDKTKMRKSLTVSILVLSVVGSLFVGLAYLFFTVFLYVLLLSKIHVAQQKNANGIVEFEKWQAYRVFLKERMDAERRSVHDIILWDYHLTYALSLGVAGKALDELDWLQGNLVEVMNGASRSVTVR